MNKILTQYTVPLTKFRRDSEVMDDIIDNKLSNIAILKNNKVIAYVLSASEYEKLKEKEEPIITKEFLLKDVREWFDKNKKILEPSLEYLKDK